MKTLKPDDVLRVLREEWAAKKRALVEKMGLKANIPLDGGSKEPVITSGLKVRHEGSNLLYTVSSIGDEDVILKSPEGDEFLIDVAALERDYNLD